MRFGSQIGKLVSGRLWVAALLAAACGSSVADPVAIQPEPSDIVIGGSLAFAPAHLVVPAGTTVHWRNDGPYAHTVTSGLSSKAADSPGVDFDAKLPSGATFDFTFEEVGDHPYFCRPHEGMGMKGVVTVTEPSDADAGAGSGSGGDTNGGGGGGGGGYGGGGY
jgi:plastocyanin